MAVFQFFETGEEEARQPSAPRMESSYKSTVSDTGPADTTTGSSEIEDDWIGARTSTVDTAPAPKHEAGTIRPTPAKPVVPQIMRHHHFKIMVVGESGLGKSTFINNLFLDYREGEKVFSEEEPALNPRTLNIVEHEPFAIVNNETMDTFHYTVVDTPGYGDETNLAPCIDRIKGYIVNQFKAFREQRVNPKVEKSTDSRVSCVLYFIAAHRLKGCDVTFIKQLKDIVMVVPLIAKADTMTEPESTAFIELIRTQLQGTLALGDATSGILQQAPFTIISSKVLCPDKGEFYGQPYRQYYWGNAFAFKERDCNTKILKKSLLENCFHDLQEGKDTCYNRWLEAEAKQERAHKKQKISFPKGGYLVASTVLVLALLPLLASLTCSCVDNRDRTCTELRQSFETKDRQLRLLEQKYISLQEANLKLQAEFTEKAADKDSALAELRKITKELTREKEATSHLTRKLNKAKSDLAREVAATADLKKAVQLLEEKSSGPAEIRDHVTLLVTLLVLAAAAWFTIRQLFVAGTWGIGWCRGRSPGGYTKRVEQRPSWW